MWTQKVQRPEGKPEIEPLKWAVFSAFSKSSDFSACLLDFLRSWNRITRTGREWERNLAPRPQRRSGSSFGDHSAWDRARDSRFPPCWAEAANPRDLSSPPRATGARVCFPASGLSRTNRSVLCHHSYPLAERRGFCRVLMPHHLKRRGALHLPRQSGAPSSKNSGLGRGQSLPAILRKACQTWRSSSSLAAERAPRNEQAVLRFHPDEELDSFGLSVWCCPGNVCPESLSPYCLN